MSRRASVEVNAVVVAATLALACGALLFAGLTIVARPSAYSARITALDGQVRAAEHLASAPGAAANFPAKALCTGPSEAAVAAFRQDIAGAASGSGLTLVSASATPGASLRVGGLTPVATQFEVTGPYAGVMALLGRLEQAQPMLFVDAVDLKSQVSSVDLKFSGRFYCSTSAPL